MLQTLFIFSPKAYWFVKLIPVMRILNASYLLNVPSWTPKIKTPKINAPGVTVSSDYLVCSVTQSLYRRVALLSYPFQQVLLKSLKKRIMELKDLQLFQVRFAVLDSRVSCQKPFFIPRNLKIEERLGRRHGDTTITQGSQSVCLHVMARFYANSQSVARIPQPRPTAQLKSNTGLEILIFCLTLLARRSF